MSAPPIGSLPSILGAVECVFLNTYQARWQYTADTIGLGFAQGKTLFYRGAISRPRAASRAGAEAAEDAASTKIVAPAARGCAWSMRRSSSRSANAARRRVGPAGALGPAAAR